MAVFDDPNLVSCAGLGPVVQLAERAGLQRLAAEHVQLGKPGGVNAHLKIGSLVAGMVAGADSIDDMALLRHGAMKRLFTGVRAPSTLGTFLRTFTFGHVRQLDAVASRLLINLVAQAPLLPGAGQLTYVDIDDTLKQTYGYAKAGAGRGYTGVKGLNALLAIVSTPSSAPVIAAARLRKGAANSARGAHRFVTDALITAKKAGAGGVLVLRADSAYYRHDVVAAATRHGARFSVTARQDSAVRKAVATICPDAWTTINYTDAVFDEDQQRWISDAQVAEVGYTAFTSKPKASHVTARLIVRRVKDMNPDHHSELFTTYRYHAVFTNSPLPMLEAEKANRAHAIVEQVIADLKNGPLGAPTVRALLGQQRLAGLRRDGVQPHPRRRRARVRLPRPRNDRHDPGAADHRPRSARPLRTTADPAPTGRLALAQRVAAARHRRQQPTARGLTDPPSYRTQPELRGDQPAPPAIQTRPHPVRGTIMRTPVHRRPDRGSWAKAARLGVAWAGPSSGRRRLQPAATANRMVPGA